MKRLKNLLAAIVWAGAATCSANDFVPLDRAAATAIADPASHARPTIVALWSSECVHCKKNLKLFAEMAKVHPRLQLITVAVEPADEGLAAPLDRAGVTGKRFAYADESPEALAYALDAKWRGELPRTLLFDGRGAREAVSGVVAEAAVLRALGLQK
ncbi:hypothetical protein ebA6153 [Aromatoleum aromaticum EbN1]|uniref:Thioredoxin domain-containing protein n=1 Tax=Aromatoleum aromaticum (strain DSM 19018 / LMG 30748 / EbN1) TaxID=76114 RepID=Q5NZ75_AROAE|nr:hypothetical protein [Aromatoleum aromaticum]CAI09639.1 hypothetical protein ebA6153 [Aromatoleum aromaticum EbN1]